MEHAAVSKSNDKKPGLSSGKKRLSSANNSALKSIIQPKLKVGSANDSFEREADSVANSVLNHSRGHSYSNKQSSLLYAQSQPNIVQRMCSKCVKEEKLLQRKCKKCDEEEKLQRKENGGTNVPKMSAVNRAVTNPGTGTPVPKSVRRHVEPVLGADLSSVRVHSDSRAKQAASDINAKAFTHKNNIFLGSGQSANDLGLMAHELTHTVQQGAVNQVQRKPLSVSQNSGNTPDIQKIDWPDIPSPGEVWDAGTDLASDAYDTASDVANDAYDIASDVASDAYDVASDAIDTVAGIATEVWDFARSLASALGGIVSISGARLVINIPSFPACPVIPVQFTLPSISVGLPIIRGALPLSPNLGVYGEVSLNLSLTPEVLGQLGPCRVNGMRIEIDPLAARMSTAGSISVTTALGIGIEEALGINGEVGAIVVLPTLPPVPLDIPVVSLEAGIAAQARGLIAETTDLDVASSIGIGSFSTNLHVAKDLGVAFDFGLGAFGELDVLGINLCRLYWPFIEYHNQGAFHYEVDAGVSIGLSGFSAHLSLSNLRTIPFGDIPLELNRDVLTDDCVLLEALCAILPKLGLMPSANGGLWKGHPSPVWPGPMDIFPRDPHDLNATFLSGAKCRGACGADCDTCTLPTDVVECVPRGANGHDLWVYPNYTECNSHQGCRDHDGCYDWCGSSGPGGLGPMLCRRLCDIECMCDYRPSQCVGWIFGGAPHDREMYFSDKPYIASSCDIPCPASGGAGGAGGGSAPASPGGWAGGGGEFGGGGASGSFGGAGSSLPAPAGGSGTSTTAYGGGDINAYSICLPTLELFGRLPWESERWTRTTPDYTIWSQWIELPPPVFLGNLKLFVNGNASAKAGVGIGPATVNNVCFEVNFATGSYLATGMLSIEADVNAELGVGGKLCTNASWLGLIDVAEGCAGVEAQGKLSLRANLDAVLSAASEMTCSSGKPTLSTDLAFLLNALLDFKMDATFRLTTLFGIEIYSTRWNLIQAQWDKKCRHGLDVNQNPVGDPTVDLRSHRFTASQIKDLLVWLFSDEAEQSEKNDTDKKEVRENPMKASTARTISAINDRLDLASRSFTSGSFSLDGVSDTAATHMVSRFTTDKTKNDGSQPKSSAQKKLYGYGKLPTLMAFNKKGYNSDSVFIKGHLLNYSKGKGLGGPGTANNLFPITGYANTSDHEKNVESIVKGLVNSDGYVVFYEVTVNNISKGKIDGLEDDVSTDKKCEYQYVDCDFVCRYATYTLYNDDSYVLNDVTSYTVTSRFNKDSFKEKMEKTSPKCPQG